MRRLKRRKGRGICLLGGGELAASKCDANLVDEIGLNVQPVLLGSGVPLFHATKWQLNLELISCEPVQQGFVYMKYRVKK